MWFIGKTFRIILQVTIDTILYFEVPWVFLKSSRQKKKIVKNITVTTNSQAPIKMLCHLQTSWCPNGVPIFIQDWHWQCLLYFRRNIDEGSIGVVDRRP